MVCFLLCASRLLMCGRLPQHAFYASVRYTLPHAFPGLCQITFVNDEPAPTPTNAMQDWMFSNSLLFLRCLRINRTRWRRVSEDHDLWPSVEVPTRDGHWLRRGYFAGEGGLVSCVDY